MSKFIQFDLSQHPLLTPKVFAMPENKEYERKKTVFLVSADKPHGIYGKDAKLEYDYEKPDYQTQFERMMAEFRRLAEELKLGVSTSHLDKILSRIIQDNSFHIAESQRKPTFQLFKQQLEDILFGMREAYTQAAGNPGSIKMVTNRIRNTIARLNDAFSNCTEGTTEAIMEQQILWLPTSDVAVWLLKRRDDIVAQIASAAVTTYGTGLSYESHLGTAARLVAAELGYGIASPAHTDMYYNLPVVNFKADAPRLLQQAFHKDYTYDTIGSYVCEESIAHYKSLLKNYTHLERLTPHEHDAVRDKLRDLLVSGTCLEADLFAAIPQTNGLTRINPDFLTKLPEYCARYTLLTLEQHGFIKNIGQLPVKAKGQWLGSSLDDRIRSYRPSSSQPQQTIDQWCAQGDAKTILTEKIWQGHFFMVFALLNKKHKAAKDEKEAHSFVFNPFHKDKTGGSLLALVCRNPQIPDDAKDGTTKSILQGWQQAILLSSIFQHPAATREQLTQEGDFFPTLEPARSYRLFNYVTTDCSQEVFNLYWNRLISLYEGQGYAALATLLNLVDCHGKTAFAYALESKDSAKIRKIAAIPGVNVKGPVTSLTVCLRDIEAEEFENAFIYFTQSLMYESTSTAVDDEKVGDAKTLFSQWEQCTTLEKCSAIHKPLKHYEQLIQLLKARYGNPEYPHHQKYQAFLQYVAEHEKYVDCLLVLKRENPAIDLDQPRVLRLKTGEEVKETPLRAAIQDDDDPMMTCLLEEALADPDTEVNGESALLLVANKASGYSPERQTALLQLLMDKNRISDINLEVLLLQLTAPERADTAFGYILEKLQQDKRHDYHTHLGEYGVSGQEFVDDKKIEKNARTQKQVHFGREEAKDDPEAERVAIAKRLGEACNKIKDSKGQSVLYRVVSTYQPKKLMSLLTATTGLNFSEAFAILGLTDAEQKEREVKHKDAVNRATVEELLRLISALQQKPTADYSTALQCFADLYVKAKNPEYYQKLLIIINNHCSKNRAIDFFKQLAAAESNVTCLQHLRKYVPIDLIKTTHYAARWDCSTAQFATLWQETVASLPDLSHADSQLKLADLVRCLLAEPRPEQAKQQREKLIIVLSDFPIIAYLKDYKPAATASPSSLDRLIRILQALEQGEIDIAITYYLIDQQQTLTEDIIVTKPMDRILTQQWGHHFLKEFSRRLKAQSTLPTGLMKVQHLIATEDKNKENSQQAARLLLRQTPASTQLPSPDLLTNLHLLLQLRYIGKDKPWIFNESLVAFFQSILAHCSANFPLQLSIIVLIMPFDMQAAAQLFCSVLLITENALLPENMILEKLKALQQIVVQQSSGTHHLSEFFSYMIGQLVFREDFREYDRLLTYCFTAMNADHAFCQARREQSMALSSPMHVALRTQHLDFLETVLTSTDAKRLQASEAFNSSPKNRTHLMRMLGIKNRVKRQKLITLWLTHDDKAARVGTVDEKDGNHALLKALVSDEKMDSPADEQTALQIWEYTLQAFSEDAERLKHVIHQNRAGESVLQLVVRNNYTALAMRILESVRIPSLSNFYTDYPRSKINRIINLICAILKHHLSPGLDGLIKQFFNCIDQDEKTSEFNTDQVIQVTRIIVKQHWTTNGIFFHLLSRYSHSKEVVSALLEVVSGLLQEGSILGIADIFKLALEKGNVALMQIALDHKPGPDAEFRSTTLISLLEESEQYSYLGTWLKGQASRCGFDLTTFTTPHMAHSIRYAFLDLFLSRDAHLDPERKLTQAVKDCAVKPTCYFTVFLKLFSHDPQNELLGIAEQKDLSPTKRIFLNLVKGLLNNPAEKTYLYAAFKQLLVLIENDNGALPMLLSVLKNKISEERVRLFLNEFLRHEKTSASDPEIYLLNTARSSRTTIADNLRVLDEKGEVALVPPSIQYALDDCCNFSTFIHLQNKEKHPFENNREVATSDLSLQKNCVLQMLALEYNRPRRTRTLEYLVLSLDEKEFANVLSLLHKKAKDLGDAIGDLLVDSARLVRIYQHKPAALRDLNMLYTQLPPIRMPHGDTICHLLIRHGCWNEAVHWLPEHLQTTNDRGDTPLRLALQITLGDAQQRLAFFNKLATEVNPICRPAGEYEKTDIMTAAESPCDTACFEELLKVSNPGAITHVWSDNNMETKHTALSLAVQANRPAKVRVLLDLKQKFDIEYQFKTLKQAQQQNSPDIVNIFWEQDKEHKLKELVIHRYQKYFPLKERSNLSLASRAIYLLHKDRSLKCSYAPFDYNSDFFLAVSQHYGSYAELFPNEKSVVSSLELLQLEFGSHINTLSLAGISPLTYALQNKEAAWLLSYLFDTYYHLTISTQQIRLICTNTELRGRWLIPALRRIANQHILNAITAVVQCYTDELQTAASASAAGITLMAWVNGMNNGRPIAFQNLCWNLLKILGRQLITRDDIASFLALYNIARDRQNLILDRTTSDTAITLAAQQGSPQLITTLLPVINKPFTTKNGSGQSALELALLRKDEAVTQVILEAKVEDGLALWPVAEGADSTLMLAVQLGDLTICQNIVTQAQQECKEHFPAFLNHKNAADQSALYLAVELQREDIVRWLLTVPGIDLQAYCATTHRTAGLCSYQRAQQDPSTQATTTEAKVEASVEAAPITMPSASPKVANAILQLFVEHKLVNSATVAVEHQLANIAQRLNHGQQDHAVQALLILVDQQGCQPLKGWLDRLTGSQPETYHTLVAQLSLSALHRAAIDHQHLSVFRDILETKLAAPLADRMADHMTDRMANITQNLQKSAILFSETTLDALFADQQLKPLWPAAALAYARACRSRPQHLEKQVPLIQKIFTLILGFPVAEAALYNEILPVVVWELTQAQQQFLITHQASERFPQWYRQIRIDRQAMLQQGIDQGNFDQVNLALTNSKMVLETKEVRYLVDVNNSFTDEKTQQPLVFTVLAKAKQESVHEEDAKHKPFYTIFKMLISHPSWQDDRKDSTRQTLLMHAITADPRIFSKILDKTTINTLLMPTPKGKTAMDFAWPNAKPAESTTGQTPQHAQEEKNKFENAKNLAAHLRKEFELCMQHIRTLQADPHNKNKNSHGDFSDWATLRAQARKLAIELLKFDEIHTRSLPKNSLVYSSFMSAISQQILLQDIQECQRVLQSGQPLSNADITGRAAKLPQFFIQQLVAAWETIVPSQTAKVEANPAQAKESQLEPPYPEQRLTFPAPSKAL